VVLSGAAILDIAVKVIAIVMVVVPLFDPAASQFMGKALALRTIAAPLFVLAIPAIWLVRRRPVPYPYLADIMLAVPIVLDAAGNGFGWFVGTPFELAPHLLGWLSLALAFGLAVAPVIEQRWVTFGLVVGFGAIVDVVWEIGEFTLARTGGSGIRLGYSDTMRDLGVSLLGAVAGGILVVTILWPRAGTPRTLFGWSPAPD
jgi:hypothetical protein